MITRELSAIAAVVGLSLTFSVGPVFADNLDSSHNTYCVRLQQVAALMRSDARLGEDMRKGFDLEAERICSSPESLFNGAPVDPVGRDLASRCYRSLSLLSTDDLTGMDMDTPECADFFSHIRG